MVATVVRVVCLAALLSLEVAKAQYNGVCTSAHYRSLSAELQNEHMCIVLEKLQQDFDQEAISRRNELQNMYSFLTKFAGTLDRNLKSLRPTIAKGKGSPNLQGVPLTRDCHELMMNGITRSGVYPVILPNRNLVNVWCDMDTAQGGWTVIQRRQNGDENFTRNWDAYTFGFGNVNGEYWLGNENIYYSTNFKNYSLRIDIWDWDDNHAYALYDYFRVDSEKEKYRLKISGYSGTAGDSMKYHADMQFSTIDEDNDRWFMSCARKDRSGWWFRSCGYASLNGLYMENGTVQLYPDGLIKGIIWYHWKMDHSYSMKRTEMKIKPLVALNIEREAAIKAKAQSSGSTMKPVTGLQETLDEFVQQTTIAPEVRSTTSSGAGKDMNDDSDSMFDTADVADDV